MKKSLSIIATTILSTTAFAGSMGFASGNIESYVGLEGSYTWTTLYTTTLNSSVATNDNQPGGGRVSAGIVRHYSEDIDLLGEIGGGYYGSSKSNNTGETVNRGIDGYDILVGASYKMEQFNVYTKFGFMMQNLRLKATRDLGLIIPGDLFAGTSTMHYNQSQTLPEIKIGSVYNIDEKLGVSISYMHVFGSNRKSNMSLSGSTPTTITGSSDRENPSLDSLLLGLSYYF